MTSAFAAPAPDLATPDPTKRVKYTLGMILGADDLEQAHAWLSGRDQSIARDLLGYGTVNGLQVTVQQDPGTEALVQVSCGSAITPRGDLVRVTPAQCAPLDTWLLHHGPEVQAHASSSPPALLPLYVVLCYDTCETDARPIPGEPCRSEEETMAPARIADAFRLELRFDAPKHDEERAVRQFVRWATDTVDIGDGPTSGSVDDFLTLLRDAAHVSSPSSPPSSPPSAPPSSPPAPDFDPVSPPERFLLDRHDACEFLRAALRVWVTELRPLWHAEFGACHCCDQATPTPAAPETCVLLARLNVTLAPDGRADASVPIEVLEDDRPVLSHLRLLQEWATCGPGEAGTGGAVGPRGARGDQGSPGEQGIRGDKGPDGDAGSPGPTGPLGAQGPDGPPGPLGGVGPLGPIGPMGPTGASGLAGAPGAPGPSGGAGLAGPDGQVGPVGAAGPQGPVGAIGPTGPAGQTGPTGPSGAQGPAGAQGDAGVAGPTGVGGPAGAAGPVGVQGAAGLPGAPGATGAAGAAGSDGAPGVPGSAGPQGPAGDPAALVGNFVEVGDPGQRYWIVAAGTAQLDQTSEILYNNLQIVNVSASGLYTIRYDKYQQPDPAGPTRLVVKVLPVFSPRIKAVLVANFVAFLPNAFTVQVADPSGRLQLAPAQFAALELMIEVSQYVRRPFR